MKRLSFRGIIHSTLVSSGSCLLTDVVDQLHEESKKVNSVERLTRHLKKGIQNAALSSYLHTIRKWVPDQPDQK
ncbi:MAG: hypothetical protein K0S76_2020 [Herbinix sp.]|jgi:hypothetical protein|nr:hypothetical protein [Herbinix sp.]